MTKTSLNLDENVEGALAYLLVFLTGIFFFLVEKKSKFVKFHAMQSTITFIVWMVAVWILAPLISWVPIIGPFIITIIQIVGLILWLLLMWNAYQGKMYKLPVIGEFAAKQIK